MMPTKNRKPLLSAKKRTEDLTPLGAGRYTPNLLVDVTLTKAQVEASLNRALIPGKVKEVEEKQAEEQPVVEEVQQPNLITNVRGVNPVTSTNFAKKLRTLQKRMTRFLVMEVVPYEAALINAKEDAEEVIKIITGAQVASLGLGKATNYIEHIIPETKTLRWFAKESGLNESDVEAIMGLYFDSLQKTPAPRKAPNHNEEAIQELIATIRHASRTSRQPVGKRNEQHPRRTRGNPRPSVEEGRED